MSKIFYSGNFIVFLVVIVGVSTNVVKNKESIREGESKHLDEGGPVIRQGGAPSLSEEGSIRGDEIQPTGDEGPHADVNVVLAGNDGPDVGSLQALGGDDGSPADGEGPSVNDDGHIESAGQALKAIVGSPAEKGLTTGNEGSPVNDDDQVVALKGEFIPRDTENQKRDLQWPLGIVPYYIDTTVYDGLVNERIRLAMNVIEESSCVQFKAIFEPMHDGSWIHIKNPDMVRNCVHEAQVTSTGDEIVIVLGLDCMLQRDILHTLMHALGFQDEITNPQRDRFVRINWDNINPKYRSLFHINYIHPTRTTEYDPMSIMHFHDRAFTKNGQATIAPLIPGLVINPSRGLSPLDKMKLRLLFGHECNRRKVGDLVDVCKAALKEEGAGGNNDYDGQNGYSGKDGEDGHDGGNNNSDGENESNDYEHIGDGYDGKVDDDSAYYRDEAVEDGHNGDDNEDLDHNESNNLLADGLVKSGLVGDDQNDNLDYDEKALRTPAVQERNSKVNFTNYKANSKTSNKKLRVRSKLSKKKLQASNLYTKKLQVNISQLNSGEHKVNGNKKGRKHQMNSKSNVKLSTKNLQVNNSEVNSGERKVNGKKNTRKHQTNSKSNGRKHKFNNKLNVKKHERDLPDANDLKNNVTRKS